MNTSKIYHCPHLLHFKSSYTIFTVRKQSCRKVMFLHLSVSHSVHGGCITACTGQTPLLDRHTFLGRHLPPAQYMLGYTHPCPMHAGIHTPLPNACCDTSSCQMHAGIHTPLGYTPLPKTITAVDGTHPTGMQSCTFICSKLASREQ